MRGRLTAASPLALLSLHTFSGGCPSLVQVSSCASVRLGSTACFGSFFGLSLFFFAHRFSNHYRGLPLVPRARPPHLVRPCRWAPPYTCGYSVQKYGPHCSAFPFRSHFASGYEPLCLLMSGAALLSSTAYHEGDDFSLDEIQAYFQNLAPDGLPFGMRGDGTYWRRP